MNEREFVKLLKERATEQKKITQNMPLPHMFSSIGILLGDHPWKILIPLAFIITAIFHTVLGKPYDEFILKIFGKL